MTLIIAKNKALFAFLVFSLVLLTVIPVSFAVEDSWVTKAPMWDAREGLGVAVVDGKIFAIGGYSLHVQNKFVGTIEVYDPDSDTWSYPKPLVPGYKGGYRAPMPTPRSRFAVAVVDDKIYCIGGWSANNETAVTEVYDPKTNTWEIKSSMHIARYDITANVVDGKIYVIGGIYLKGEGHGYVALTEVYDPATDCWTLDAPIPNAVGAYASTVVDNKIYIFGGHNGKNLTQIYDPQTGNWSFGAEMLFSTYYAAAAKTTDVMAPELVYVLGGTGGGVGRGTNQIYNPKNDSWRIGTPMPTTRISLAVAVIDDTIYTIGGDRHPSFRWRSSIIPVCCAVTEQYIPLDYIPEFSSWVVLPLFLVVTLLVVAVKWKAFRPT